MVTLHHQHCRLLHEGSTVHADRGCCDTLQSHAMPIKLHQLHMQHATSGRSVLLLSAATVCRKLEEYMAKYGDLCESFGERRVTIRKLETVEEVLKEADVRTCRLCVLWAWLGLAGFAVQHGVIYIRVPAAEREMRQQAAKQALSCAVIHTVQNVRVASAWWPAYSDACARRCRTSPLTCLLTCSDHSQLPLIQQACLQGSM